MNWKNLNLNLAWTLFLATLLFCGAAAAATSLTPCQLPHYPERVGCGSIDVPEHRVLADGRPTL